MTSERDGERNGERERELEVGVLAGGGEHYLSLGRAMSGSSKRDLGADCDALA